MEADVLIEPETPADYEAIDRVHRLAFGQEAEAGLVRALREQGYTRPYHSLVARIEGEIVGHVLFSSLPIEHDGGTMDALSLAPVAVIPSHQRKGIGSKLIRAGLERARADRTPGVVVLGDVDYYARFGFSVELASHIDSPYSGSHFMALELVPGAISSLKNALAVYPAPFSSL